EYVYDAGGTKLKKIVHETGRPDKTTLYIGGFVYDNDTLQLMHHEEGRIRLTANTSNAYNGYAFDYFEKDHLGNVRVVLTEQRDTAAYPEASMETANLGRDTLYYSKVSATRIQTSNISGYPASDSYTNPNDWVSKTNGSGNKIGTGIVLKVMAGDQFNLRVSSWYKTNGTSPGTPVSPVNDIVAALVAGISGAGKFGATELQTGSLLSDNVTDFLNAQTVDAARPKAYINWVLLDEQLKYVSSSSGFEQVPAESVYGNSGSSTSVYVHTQNGVVVNKSGYLYIYVSNETPNMDVYFDNLQVTHLHGPLVEETHYYPFGLTMAGVSFQARGKVDNKRKFNKGSELQSKEFNNGSGLELYATNFRNLDPQLGRWFQIDPKPNYSQSLYSIMNNNPISFNDPFGDTIRHSFRTGFLGIFGNKVTVDYRNGNYYNAGTNTTYIGKTRNYQKSLLNDLIALSNNSASGNMMEGIVNSTQIVQIKNGGSAENTGAQFESATAAANPGQPLIINYSVGKSFNSSDINQYNSTTRIPGYVALAHEFAHVQDWMKNGRANFIPSTAWYTSSIDGRAVARSEIFATDMENRLRSSLGLPLREFYGADRSRGIKEGQILLPGTRTNANLAFVNGGLDAAGHLIPITY
ncbi:MAG: RHS repeat-associated core domain-containing protein, partial [Chitinophagaceae bacterium]